MRLDGILAEKIVKRAMKIIGHSVNVMDEQGIIIASGDIRRLRQLHTGAVLALRENRIVEIDDTLAQKWNFEAQPGINLPIRYMGKNIGVVGISGNPDKLKDYAELVRMTAELIVEQDALVERQSWERRYKEEFILQLIKGNLSQQEMVRQAAFFTFSLDLPRVVLLIKLLNPNVENLQHLVNYLEQSGPSQEVAILSLDQIVVLQPLKLFNLDNTLLPSEYLDCDYKVAVGVRLAEARGDALSLSYRTALTTLDYGLKQHPRKQYYLFEDYRLPVLLAGLADSWQAEELLKPLAPLRMPENKVLLKTLQQYFLANCDPLLSAQKLYIHPNTLRYRLTKIEQVTGLSFNNIDDKLSFYLAIVLGI